MPTTHTDPHAPPPVDPHEEAHDAKSLKEAIASAPRALKRWTGGLLIGCVVIAIGIAAVKHVLVAREAAFREAELKAGPRTRVATVARSSGERFIEVVGEARPYASVTLYAKVSGYLKEVKVDKGDKVKQGQVLAIIEAPETNKSYEGAKADAANKNAVASRMKELYQKELVSAQEYDQSSSDAKMAQARFESLAVQKDYETLRAPFDGTVTARFADAGALVQNAANSQTSALPVVNVAQVERLRVYCYIDQRDASFVQAGLPVVIRLSERPDLELHATVARVAGELDSKTRMLLTEIDVDNRDGQVVPGSFVQVDVHVKTPPFLQVPAEAVVNQADKHVVPVISKDDVMNYREVRIADTDGKMVRILSGLEEGERVALNLGNTLPDGSHVRPMEEPAKPASAAPPGVKALENPPTGAPGAKPDDKVPDAKPVPKDGAPASDKAGPDKSGWRKSDPGAVAARGRRSE